MLALMLLAAAQPPAPPPDRALTKTLVVSPAAAPRPALRFELLPRPSAKSAGNAAIAYHRAIASRPAAETDPAKATAAQDKFDKWIAADLDTFPAADVTAHLAGFAASFRELDRGGLSTGCDWELLPRLKAEGVALLLPELQPQRELARALALRTRLELAGGRFDAAEKSLRTGFQLAKHVGEGPTLINLLVGLAIQATFLDRVDDWVARPGSPNLYWALTALPAPLIDPRPAFDGETLFVDTAAPSLAKFRGGPLSKADAARFADDVFRELVRVTERSANFPAGLDKATLRAVVIGAYVGATFDAAKADLIARGRPEKEVLAMPPVQVVVVSATERFAELRDDQWKWVGVPYHLGRDPLRAAAARTQAATKAGEIDLLFRLLSQNLPASEKVSAAAARADRRVAALRVVEALRQHAAATGKPPARLTDVTAVPLPDDPVLGKPFEYAATPTGFTLTAPPPAGEKPSPQTALVYEVTLRK